MTVKHAGALNVVGLAEQRPAATVRRRMSKNDGQTPWYLVPVLLSCEGARQVDLRPSAGREANPKPH